MFQLKTCVYVYTSTIGIEGIHMKSFYYSISNFIKLSKTDNLRQKKNTRQVATKMGVPQGALLRPI